MKIFKRFLSLPDMVREEEETTTVDTRDQDNTLDDVSVAEAKEQVCPG